MNRLYMNEVGRDSILLAISGTVGGATVVKLPSHIPARPAYVCALISKVSCWFYVNLRFLWCLFCFFNVTQYFSLFRGNSRKQMCCLWKAKQCCVRSCSFMWCFEVVKIRYLGTKFLYYVYKQVPWVVTQYKLFQNITLKYYLTYKSSFFYSVFHRPSYN
jgi:hypothetical protein